MHDWVCICVRKRKRARACVSWLQGHHHTRTCWCRRRQHREILEENFHNSAISLGRDFFFFLSLGRKCAQPCYTIDTLSRFFLFGAGDTRMHNQHSTCFTGTLAALSLVAKTGYRDCGSVFKDMNPHWPRKSDKRIKNLKRNHCVCVGSIEALMEKLCECL